MLNLLDRFPVLLQPQNRLSEFPTVPFPTVPEVYWCGCWLAGCFTAYSKWSTRAERHGNDGLKHKSDVRYVCRALKLNGVS